MKQIANHFLVASSASYFLISWQKPYRFLATVVEYFLEYFKFFMASTFSEAKSGLVKTFAVYLKSAKVFSP